MAVILTVATGCDNVAWGGVEVELMPPPTAVVGGGEDPDPAGGTETPRRVRGPLLLAGVREGSQATLTVVGEVRGDSVTAFPDPAEPDDPERVAELMAVGSEWILFAEGVRVGRLQADRSGTSDEYCTPRAFVSGVVELVPDAGGVERLLALPASVGEERPYRDYAALSRDYDQGVATLTIAQQVIPRVGAPWPAEGLLAARQDIQAFQPDGLEGQAVAATFLYRDQLAVAPPGQGAYAVFVLGTPAGSGYREGYSWYRAVATDGKGVPTYFAHLDWDGDGDSEILLDVLGSNRRWHAGLSQRQGEWVRTFQHACGSGSSAGG